MGNTYLAEKKHIEYAQGTAWHIVDTQQVLDISVGTV